MDSKSLEWTVLRNDVRQSDHLVEQMLEELDRIAHIDEHSINDEIGNSPGAPIGVSPKVTFGGSGLTQRSISPPQKSLREVQAQFSQLEGEISTSLHRLDQLLSSMVNISSEFPSMSEQSKHTERFLSLARDKRCTLARIVQDFKRRRERLELLPSISSDLRKYREHEGVRILMDEQSSLQHTHARVNSIMEEANVTQRMLRSQRARFDAIGDRLLQLAERVPVIQNVLRRIDSVHRRDALTLGTVVAICMFLFVIFL